MVHQEETMPEQTTEYYRNRVEELEQLLVLREDSTRERAFSLAQKILKDSPAPAGIIGRRRLESPEPRPTTILYINDAFCSYLGHKRKDIVNQPYYKFIEGVREEIITKLSGVPFDGHIKVIKRNRDVIICRLLKDDYWVGFCGRKLYVLSWFFLYPIEENENRT